MALPDLVRLTVEKKLADYCRSKVPPAVSDKLRLDFRIRGESVTLYESRPFYADPKRWIDAAIAQFQYDLAAGTWTLYWPDRNARWHRFADFEPTLNFERLLKTVDDDPTGVFWG